VDSGSNLPDARITISLTQVPLAEALRYVTDAANLKYKVERYAVQIVPRSANIETLITKEYKVRPGFHHSGGGGGGGCEALAPTAPADATKGGSSIAAGWMPRNF
jgi:general secretion pathway protein D